MINLVERKKGWVLLLLCFCLFLPGIKRLPVTDVDEARFVQATRQMIEQNDYWHIRIQHHVRHRKPPGIYWLQAASTRFFQDAPWSHIESYRWVSVLSAIVAVFSVFFLFSNVLSGAQCFSAAMAFASTLLLVVEAHIAKTDACLLACVVLMQGCLWRVYHGAQSKPSLGWALGFWFAMAIGIVIKGLAPVFGLLTVGMLCVLERNLQWMRALHWKMGLLILVGVTAAWLWPLQQATHGQFLSNLWHGDLYPKLVGGHEGHGRPTGFFLLLLPITAWPWSCWIWPLFQSFWQSFRETGGSTWQRFLVAWVVPNWILFECVPTKLPHYVLPMYPALVLGLASLDSEFLSKRKSVVIHWCLVSFLLAAAFVALSVSLMHQLLVSAGLIVAALSLGSLIAVRLIWRGKKVQAQYLQVVLAAVVYGLAFCFLLPQLKPVWLSEAIHASIVKHDVKLTDPLYVVGYHAPSLIFLLGTEKVVLTDFETLVKQKEPQNILLPTKKSSAWKHVHWASKEKPAPYCVRDRIRGLDNNGHHRDLQLLTRGTCS